MNLPSGLFSQRWHVWAMKTACELKQAGSSRGAFLNSHQPWEAFQHSKTRLQRAAPHHQVRTDSNRNTNQLSPPKSPSILNHVLSTDPLRRTIYLPLILLHWPGNRRPGDPTYSPVLLRLRAMVFVPLAHLEICWRPEQPHPQKLKQQFSCKLTRLSPPLCNDCLHSTFFSGPLSKC